MTGKDFKHVHEIVENEGFDYAFVGYSDFEKIKDEEFHRLRKAYLKARSELIDFLGIED